MRDHDVISTYCPPKTSIQLNDERHILLQGPRGSGKSTVLRNITASPLPSKLNQSTGPARATYSPEGDLVIGTYINVGQPWVAGFQRRAWLEPTKRLALFTQAFNLLIASQFTETLKRLAYHLANDDIELEARFEHKFSNILHDSLFKASAPPTASARELASICSSVQQQVRDSILRALFGEETPLPERLLAADIFEPITKTITTIGAEFKEASEALWVFAFDELDNLDEEQQRLFNTLLRNTSRPITIKGACLPHGHKTLQTLADRNPVLPGEDFDYVALSLDPKTKDCATFCLELYQTRLQNSPPAHLPVDPKKWLGSTTLRDRAQPLLERSFKTPSWSEALQRLLTTKTNKTQDLFLNTLSPPTLNEDSLRQYIPPLAIKLLRKSTSGNTADIAYAGWSDVVAASDGNPRRLLRLLDRLYEVSSKTQYRLSPDQQSDIIKSIAEGAFERLLALPNHGRAIQKIVSDIGSHLENRIHRLSELVADSCSFELDLGALPLDSKSAFETAIAYGVIFPWAFDPRSGYPTGRHAYWLSFGIAPKFWLVLRRGRPLNVDALQLDENRQLSFIRLIEFPQLSSKQPSSLEDSMEHEES